MKPEFVKQLTSMIKKVRKKSGLTQQGLAEFAGVGKTAVYDLEHQKDTVQLKTILSVLEVLNIKLALSAPFEDNT